MEYDILKQSEGEIRPVTKFEKNYGNTGGESQTPIKEILDTDLDAPKGDLYLFLSKMKRCLDKDLSKGSFVIAKDGQFESYLHEANNKFRVLIGYEMNPTILDLPFFKLRSKSSLFRLGFCEPKNRFPLDFAEPYLEKKYLFDNKDKAISGLVDIIKKEYFQHNQIDVSEDNKFLK